MSGALTLKAESGTPYQLDPDQTLRAATALLTKIKSDALTKRNAPTDKPSLLEDEDAPDSQDEDSTPIWLTLNTKRHIVDKKRLKPAKVLMPHSLYATTSTDSPTLRICLITADPQRMYKDLIADPAFPTEVSSKIARVIGLSKLTAKYHSFESKRQLAGEYDLFLADDRVITSLPRVLGKTFYTQGSKRPVPINLQGRKDDNGGEKRVPLAQGGTKLSRQTITPASLAHEIGRATNSALVHLSPSTSTAIRIGTSAMTASQVADNIAAVVPAVVERFIPSKWRNVRSIHVKGPATAALPIWLASELWVDDADVLLEADADVSVITDGKKKATKDDKKSKTKRITAGETISKGDSKGKKRKADGGEDKSAVRKDMLKKQKLQARKAVSAAVA